MFAQQCCVALPALKTWLLKCDSELEASSKAAGQVKSGSSGVQARQPQSGRTTSPGWSIAKIESHKGRAALTIVQQSH